MATLLEPTGLLAGEIAEIAQRIAESVVQVNQGGGNGAGVIWRSDGQIVTNSHVASSEQVEVVLADGRKFTGKVTARHPNHDLAIVQIPAEELPAVEVGDSSTVRPGQIALAVGHPLGMRNAISAGIIVAAGQVVTENGPRTGDLLQADVTLLPGNSGGPLVDAAGGVIGINTMVAGQLSLAIPSQAVETFVAGKAIGVGRAFLGIIGVPVQLKRPEQDVGFLLTEVEEGGPADRAGLFTGDIITAIGDATVIDQESVPATVLRLVPGDAVTMHVLRGGEPRSFVVVPTERA
ncbi:MAG: S1C family serine protease [Thermomicrobiales bacterium]